MTIAEVELEAPVFRSPLAARTLAEPARRLAAGSSVVGSGPFAALELAAKRAREERSLDAAAKALRAAAILAEYEGGRYRHLAQLEEMRLRTEFIVEMGSRAGDSVLDAGIVLRWFLDELPYSAATARETIARLDDLAADELRTLRLLKSRLGLVQQLSGCGELPDGREWQEWRKLYDLLP